MNWSHALAQADKHQRWHRDHPEGGCESGLCEGSEPMTFDAPELEVAYAE